MKSIKKLLLCIVISILIANFIIMGVTIVDIIFEHPTSTVEIFKNNSDDEELIGYYKGFEEQMLKIKESDPKQYNADFPIYGMFASILPLTVLGPMVSMYILSIVVGIIVGIMIYLIFIENKKGMEAVIAFTICFIITLVLYRGLIAISELTSNLIYNQYDEFEWYELFVGYAIAFAVLYVVNLIYQKRIANKLNRELNK